MPDVYTAAFLFMVTFLLICWVVTEFQIYNDSHSMNDELKKPHMASGGCLWVRTDSGMHWTVSAISDRTDCGRKINPHFFLASGAETKRKRAVWQEERISVSSARN